MQDQDLGQDNLAYDLALNLLPYLNDPIAIEIRQRKSTQRLQIEGELVTAFSQPGKPTITARIGGQTTTIRITKIKTQTITKHKSPNKPKLKISLLLTNTTNLTIEIPCKKHRRT